jgi:hypothetical protein
MNWRVKLGIMLVVFFSFFQSFRALEYYNPLDTWKTVQRRGEIPSDFLNIYKKNISCLLPELPSGQVVGFVTSVPINKQQRDAVYHMTQFAIVPFLLDDSLNYDLVIAYFPNRIKPKPGIPIDFLVAKQCTDEIFLLRRNAQ